MMEGNKDESEKCIKLAEQFFNQGNLTKAEKYLDKAERLYPSNKAKQLLEQIHNKKEDRKESNAYSRYTENRNMSNGDIHPENMDDDEEDGDSSHQHSADYSQTQLDLVERIRARSDYYEILGLSKEASDEGIKKSYRKLALQLHPDKNRAPGSTEAFKKVAQAFAVLSDAQKRAHYDKYGLDAPTVGTTRRRHYTDEYYEEIDPEEIFNMFFGGAFPTGNVRNFYYTNRGARHAAHQRYHHAQPEPSIAGFIQLMPLILIVLLSFISAFMYTDPPYSLHRDRKYTDERRTGSLRVTYYVKPDFLKQHQGDVLRIEKSVEDDYIHHLRHQCIRERNYKENALWRARVYSDSEMWEEAQKLSTPSCDTLQALYT